MRRSSHAATHGSVEYNTELEVVLESPADGEVSLAFPEGGREAWICLIGSSLMMFPSFGFQTAGEKDTLLSYSHTGHDNSPF